MKLVALVWSTVEDRVLDPASKGAVDKLGAVGTPATHLGSVEGAAFEPSAAELEVLATALKRHQEHYRQQPKAAVELLAVGESPRDEKIDPVELAAYATVANLILNLDETITKE